MPSEFKMPTDDLLELKAMLEEGQLEVLRDQTARARRTKQRLERFTSRIWLFPFGITPSTTANYPIQVFRNGSAMWMNEEVKLITLEGNKRLTVAVFRYPMREDDLILAEYLAVPIGAT